ncbi:choice-of-anchor L domain-containing protein [Sphingobacterium wenxiniae]|nr:choice-of-anchor L domain-containing protein [Sphingobacterium wenxiniae]
MKKVIKSFALKCAVVAHLVILSMVSGVFGQATVVNNNPNATQIAAGLNANGLVINNPQIVRGGNNNQIAIFSNGINGANLGVDAGVLFSTGHAVNELTKKNSSSSSSLQSSVSAQTGTYSDAQLTNITSNAIYDAVVYTFDITLTGGADALRIAYQFGSEEYPDYVGSVYNDTFGFFVRRKGTTGEWINMARLPNAAQTVTAINKVNFGKQGNNYSGTGNGYESSNSNHYERNGHTTATTSGNPNRLVLNNNPGPFPIHVEYNGLT